MTVVITPPEPCKNCNFQLFNPVHEFNHSNLVFYNDSRFRGRCILSLKKHFDNWEDVDEESLLGLMKESQQAVRAIKKATGCKRVNIASLSNQVAHIHLHLIPRFPDEEEFPNGAPWRDRREQTEMTEDKARRIVLDIQKYL